MSAFKRNLDLAQFFTPEKIAQKLASYIPKTHQAVAIADFSVGTGNLLDAMQNRFSPSDLFGIDIDPRCILEARQRLPSAELLEGNALSRGFFDKLLGKDFDIVALNPPFGRVANSVNARKILLAAGLVPPCDAQSVIDIEPIFIALGLRALHDGGYLALIVRDGILSGSKFSPFRQSLLQHCTLVASAELPNGAFVGTEAKCHLVILQKGPSFKRKARFELLTKTGKVESTFTLDLSSISDRFDFAAYAHISKHKKSISLRDMGAHVERGSAPSAQIYRRRLPVVHTTNLDLNFNDCILESRQANQATRAGLKMAIPGDILVARTGSRCLHKIAMVKDGPVLFSDAIYRINLPKSKATLVWKILRDEWPNRLCQTLAKGACAAFITKDDILNIGINVS